MTERWCDSDECASLGAGVRFSGDMESPAVSRLRTGMKSAQGTGASLAPSYAVAIRYDTWTSGP